MSLKRITCILAALVLFSGAAVASSAPVTGEHAWISAYSPLPAESSGPDGLQILTASDLLDVTGMGLFKRLACAAAAGVAGGSLIGGTAAVIVGTTIPPVGIIVGLGATAAGLACYIF